MSHRSAAAIGFVLLAACILIGVFFLKTPKETHPIEDAALKLNDSNFDAEIEKHKGAVLVDFSAAWCGPCREIAPFVEALALDYKDKLTVGKVDVDASLKLDERFKISGIPLLVILKDGKRVDSRVGAMSKDALKQWVDEVLKPDFKPNEEAAK